MMYEHREYEKDHEYNDDGMNQLAVVKSHGIQVIEIHISLKNMK